MLNPEPLDHYLCRANFWFWKCNVPSKISIFVWRLLQIRLPTRDLLIRWGVLIANDYAKCVLCSRESVNANYISFFFHANFPTMCGEPLTCGLVLWVHYITEGLTTF